MYFETVWIQVYCALKLRFYSQKHSKIVLLVFEELSKYSHVIILLGIGMPI